MEYILVNQFREHYHLTEEEVPDSFLKGYIKERAITESDISKRDWASVAKALFSRGVTYGHSITNMISRDFRFAQSEENFDNATHLIVRIEIFTHDGLSEPRYFVIDREDNILYYSKKEIRLDYSQAEVSISMSCDEADKVLKQLRKIINSKWEVPFGLGERADYQWNLFILLPEGDMIRYEGEGKDEEHRPGFDMWCQQLREEIINA